MNARARAQQRRPCAHAHTPHAPRTCNRPAPHNTASTTHPHHAPATHQRLPPTPRTWRHVGDGAVRPRHHVLLRAAHLHRHPKVAQLAHKPAAPPTTLLIRGVRLAGLQQDVVGLRTVQVRARMIGHGPEWLRHGCA